MDKEKEIKELIDEFHYEKLGDLLAKMKNWNLLKDLFFQHHYNEKINEIDLSLHQNQHEVLTQLSQLETLLNEQIDSLSKLKSEYRGSPSKKKSIHDSVYLNYIKYLGMVWKDKRERICEMWKFCQTFQEIIRLKKESYQKIYGKVPNSQRKIKDVDERFKAKYSKNMEFMEMKKNKKYFNLTKFRQMENIFREQHSSKQKIMNELETTQKSLLTQSQRIYRILSSNLANYRELFLKCFGDDINLEIQDKMEEKIKSIDKHIRNSFSRSQQRELNLSQLLNELKNNSTSMMNQISIREWKINVKGKENSYLQKKGILTMDSKFYITDHKEEISGEFNLVEAEVTSIDEFGQIIVRQKKEKVKMKFESEIREDEFFLHLKKVREEL